MLLADLGALAEVGGDATEVGDLRRVVQIELGRAATGLERQAEEELVVVLPDVVALELIAAKRRGREIDAARVLHASGIRTIDNVRSR